MIQIEQQILDQLKRLDSQQQQQVLDYAQALAHRPKGTPGSVFVERTSDIHISPDNLRVMEQAIEEDCERIDPDAWNLSD